MFLVYELNNWSVNAGNNFGTKGTFIGSVKLTKNSFKTKFNTMFIEQKSMDLDHRGLAMNLLEILMFTIVYQKILETSKIFLQCQVDFLSTDDNNSLVDRQEKPTLNLPKIKFR